MVVGETPTPHTTQSLRLRRGFFFAVSRGMACCKANLVEPNG